MAAPQDYDSTHLLEQPQELKNRAERDGFLFFRKLLPQDPIMELRKEALSLVQNEGLLNPDHDLIAGIADLEKCRDFNAFSDTCLSRDAYNAVQSLPLFHELAHHPKLLKVFSTLFGEKPLVHPRHIMRLVVPGKNVHPTAPHQDIVYISGTENTWTSWIPLGDCSREIGNLSILKGSHRCGVLPVHRGLGAGGLECELPENQLEWIELDYQAGDIITFTSTTVHKSLPTQRPERVRLSLDYRYQPLSQPVHVSSLKPHMGSLSWDEIYKSWPKDDYKYYWEKESLTTTKETSFERFPQLADGMAP